MLSNPGRIFRELLKGPNALVAPGAYDGISARLIERAGFKSIYRTGGGTSATLLGQPDLGLTTLTEMVDHATRISAAVNLPVIADADTGYGNVLNVIRTVHEFERAGVAAIHLEDQVFPKRCAFMAGKEVVPIGEFVDKIKAALAERMNEDFMIIARSDARGSEGLQKSIDRCKHYIDAGAEMLFYSGPESLQDIEEVSKQLGGAVPLMANMSAGSATPSLTVSELEQMGYKFIIFPGMCMFVAISAIQESLAFLKERGTDEGAQGDRKLVGPLDFYRQLGLDDWMEIEKKYGIGSGAENQ